MKQLIPSLLMLFVALLLFSHVSLAANLLTNPGFEEGPAGTTLPPGWVIFSGSLGENIWVEAAEGGQVLILDSKGTRNTGLRSEPIPAREGERFEASVRVYVQPGNRPSLFIDFLDANKKRIAAPSIAASPSTAGEWQTLSLSVDAPAGTEWVTIILYANANSAPGRVAWDDAVLALDKSYVVSLTPDHEDHLYELGETATFTLRVLQGGRPVERAGAQWRLTLDGLEQLASGIAVVENGEAQIKAKLDEPGFLRLHVTVVGRDGSATADAAVAFSPELIRIARPEPDDFDAFWQARLAELAEVPVEAELTPVPSGVAGVEAFDVRVKSLGAPVSGYFARPANAKPGTLPAIITLHGAGVSSARLSTATGWARDGLLAMDINAHGIPNGQPASYYNELAQTTLYDYRSSGRESRDEFYFLGMFLRVVRAIDFITSQPEWDGRTLILYGTSQGGAQALAGAGLDERVSFFVAGVPSMADFGGVVKDRPMRWDLRAMPAAQAERIRETLQYFDTAYFAARTKADGFFTAAFLDSTVHPTTVYAARNAVAGSAGIFNDPLVGHTNTSEALAAMRAAIFEHIAKQKSE